MEAQPAPPLVDVPSDATRMEAQPTPTRLVDVPSDAIQYLLLSLGERLSSPEQQVRALCSLAATCTRLRNEVARAETLWHDLAQACYPEGERPADQPAPLGRSELCARLAAWRKYADGIEVPSAQQMVQVISRSANAHSYYKHLNIGRTAPFSFHLSQVAGKRRVRGSDGEADHYIDYVRGDGTEFHYTWTPTAEYRRKFGMVAYTDGASMRPGSAPPGPRVLELAHADATVVLQPAYVDAASYTFCSAVVHGEGEPRQGHFEVAYERLQAEGVEALQCRMRQAEICDAALQRRQMNCEIEIPRSVLGFLTVMAKWEEPLREALAALLARPEWTALVEAVGFMHEAAMQRPAMLSDKKNFTEKKALRLLLASLAHSPSASGSGARPLAEALAAAKWAAGEMAAILHELGDGLFPALPGRARAAAVEHVVLQFTVHGSGRRHAATAAVELAERVDERLGMFDALARMVGFVRGSPTDVSQEVYDDPKLYGQLLGMEKQYPWM
mmetsp:Transcript_68644/g.205870  ORF Transcript_68644/g.205870 Transcript_68644/m.205870 type:complete len:501 (+) Transcript_68644:32-1534(+)